MAYPGRPVRDPLPQFVGTANPRQTDEQRQALIAFAVEQYENGASLREIAEWSARSQTAIRRALDQGGVTRRGRGAYRQTNARR